MMSYLTKINLLLDIDALRYWQGSKDKDVIDFMNKNYPPGFTYADFGPMFTAEFYDPDEWSDILQNSGAK